MLFNSVTFLIFFAIIYVSYLLLRHRWQNILLLVASYVFYGWWDWRFLSLILASTVVDYFCGLRMAEAEDTRRRKRLLTVSLLSNLGMLGYFKYYDFFVSSLEAGIESLGFETGMLHLNIILPVGISFYTFQTLSYTIDIYRGKLEPSRRFLDFALFVSFFPQLVAGPIERASRLLPQIQKPRTLTPGQFKEGVYLILWGFFKKVFVADNCACIVNTVFCNHTEYGGLEMLVAVYAFAFQIYCDFSGYSDIARGLGKLMGFNLMMNFKLPYFSTNPAEFWSRWNISLSSWLRDYLYFSMGGSRCGTVKAYRNIFMTMLLGGLWHGAKWTMAFWGVMLGLILMGYRMIYGKESERGDKRYLFGPVGKIAAILFFFHFMLWCFLIFRVESWSQISDFVSGIFFHMAITPEGVTMLGRFLLLVCMLLFIETCMYVKDDLLLPLRFKAHWQVLWGMMLGFNCFIYWILYQSGLEGGKEFVYFQI